MPHIAMDYHKYLPKRQSRKSHIWRIQIHTLHKLVARSFNLLLFGIDWTVKWDLFTTSTTSFIHWQLCEWRNPFFLMKKERHRPQRLYLIKRDSSQTSLGGEEQPGRLIHCVTLFPQQTTLLLSTKICTHAEKVACVSVLCFQIDAAGVQTVINCGPDQQPGSGSI